MKIVEENRKIRIHYSFLIYILTIGLFSSWLQVAAVLSALMIHEAAHCIVSVLIGDRIRCIDLTPFGGVITCRSSKAQMKGIRGFAVAASGPLANCLCLVVLSKISVRGEGIASFKSMMITAHLAMFIMNMLPVLPLDGGRMVFCVAYYLFSASPLIFWLTTGGICTGSSIVLLAFYVLVQTKRLNLSLLIIGFYIIIAALHTKEVMITENAYVILREEQPKRNRIQRTTLYRVDADTPLLSLLPYIEKSRSSVFAIDHAECCRCLQDDDIRNLLLHSPELTMIQAVRKANTDFL